MNISTFKFTFLLLSVFGISNPLYADDCKSLSNEFFKDDSSYYSNLILGKKKLVTEIHQNFTQQNIDPNDAFEMINSYKDNPNFIVLDVRTPGEFYTFHIQGAQNLDFKTEDFMAKISELDRSKVYLIHCASGMRAQKALSILNDLNFQHIYNMDGGIYAWDDLGLPTVDQAGNKL